ncbi:MAG: glycosyltransferase family 2 protein [Phycisphaerae bacterium]
MMKVSACIICKNQAHRIGLALDSLAWCEEIVVVDSGSTDGTVELARGHSSGKVRVMEERWRGYNPQREFAASQCVNAWVLMLDADEEVSAELREEILGLREEEMEGVAIFEMPRKNFVAKRYVRCWSPDFQTRLIHRERTAWGKQSAPEIREAKAGFVVKKLRGVLLHNRLTEFVATDFCDGRRMEEHANILADAMWARGKRAGFWNLLFRPGITFLKYYVMKGSFLDGRFGLVIALKTTVGVILKYSVLYGREFTNDEIRMTNDESNSNDE